MHDEQDSFEDDIHLYATNDFVILHNKKILNKLNMQVAQCYNEERKKKLSSTIEDE